MRPAELLNRECLCVPFSAERLGGAFAAQPEADRLTRLFAERPHLFAAQAVFIDADVLAAMRSAVRLLSAVIALPRFRETVLARSHQNAQHDPGSPGAALGFDFHLAEDGPKLIEINTNAGGALINSLLLRALPDSGECLTATDSADACDAQFAAMFSHEWRLQRGDAPLQNIAIVDNAPEQQYLYPEFLLAQQLFAQQGWHAHITDPAALTRRDGALWLGDTRIDLVYNRLTDFALQLPAHQALRDAWLQNEAVITPHPRAHALYADKRNLALFSSASSLQSVGADADTAAAVQAFVPETHALETAPAEHWWQTRKQWFFKPAEGYGSKAAYRGEKITRKVFEEIITGSYVAQKLVPPSERRIRVEGELQDLRKDIRAYAYNGEVFLFAARLYQGQTTNFRTPGGGFAPVLPTPAHCC